MQDKKPEIKICTGSSCFARGNEANLGLIEKYMEAHSLKDEVDLELGCSLCQNKCSCGPNIQVNGVDHQKVDKGTMKEILKNLFETEK